MLQNKGLIVQNLVEKACEIFDMKLLQLAEHTGIPKTTLQTWKDKGECSQIGEIALNALIENHELKKKDEAFKHLLSLYSIKAK